MISRCALCLSRLRSLFLAGERCDVETLEWAKNSFGVPVLDHWWQTGRKAFTVFDRIGRIFQIKTGKQVLLHKFDAWWRHLGSLCGGVSAQSGDCILSDGNNVF